MWSRILSSSTFRPTSGSDLWIRVKSVLGSGMAFTSSRKVSGLTFDRRMAILKCISESVLDASPASMKISDTSSSVDSSQPSSTCRYGSYLVCTWCHTKMLSFRCWPFLLAMDLNTAGTQAFFTSSENSQEISLIFVIIRLYSFSPSTWTNFQKI